VIVVPQAKKMIMAAVLQNGGVPDASGGVSPRARRSASPRTMALAAAGAGGAEVSAFPPRSLT
jgi:hypothetical protein